MPRARGRLWIGIALLAGGCSPEIDPLSQRCLQALAYRQPAPGEFEITESRPGPGGSAVAIDYVAAGDSQAALPQRITCEFESDDRWRFRRIHFGGRDLSEAELALVNAEFLLRDLDRHPERFTRDAHWTGNEPVADRHL